MKKRSWLVYICLSMMGVQGLQAQEVLPLYPGAIPGAKETPAGYHEVADIRDGKLRGLSKVYSPELRVFRPAPDTNTGAAVIICPGGGYAYLAIAHEGEEVARRFAAMGVTAVVLKYRLPDDVLMVDKSKAPLQDAQQAIYTVRKNAVAWGVDPARIGIMGFSAGGHLAGSLTVHYTEQLIQNPEKLSLRPDFSVLIYPVMSAGPSRHQGSLTNLLGASPTDQQLDFFSNDKRADAKTPPTFLVHANDDDVVPVENSILFNQALHKNKVPVETHLYQAGGHGFGMHNPTTGDDWFERLANWMKSGKLLK